MTDILLLPDYRGEAEPEQAVRFTQGMFTVDEQGLFVTQIDRTGNSHQTWLASPIYVHGLARTEEGRGWSYYVGFLDPDTAPQHALLSKADEHDCANWWSALGERGLTIAPDAKLRRLVAEYIIGFSGPARFTLVHSVGWNKQNDLFVLPSGIAMGDGAKDTLFVPGGAEGPVEGVRPECSLDDWKANVADACDGNSRLVLALCAAFAAPLLKPLGQTNLTVNLFGQSSTGKSTALNVAASVCGAPDEYARSWNATAAGLEQFLARRNDSLVCLDEIGEASDLVLEGAPYAIASGKGKLKSNKAQTLQPTETRRTVVLSAGELTYEQALSRNGRKVQAGQAIRHIDLPADAGAGMGVFEKLNGHSAPRQLADALNAASRLYHIIALDAFVDKLISPGSLPAVTARAARELGVISSSLCPSDASGQVVRVAQSFALLAFAGRLACDFEVLPFQQADIDDAISKCFTSWLAQRGTAGELEPEECVQQVRMFCQAHGRSRFETWDCDPSLSHVRDRVGYIRPDGTAAGFYVFPEAFKKVLCEGLDHRRVARVLQERGLLLTDPSGNPSKTVHVPRNGPKRLYHLAMDIIGTTETEGAQTARPSPRGGDPDITK